MCLKIISLKPGLFGQEPIEILLWHVTIKFEADFKSRVTLCHEVPQISIRGIPNIISLKICVCWILFKTPLGLMLHINS